MMEIIGIIAIVGVAISLWARHARQHHQQNLEIAEAVLERMLFINVEKIIAEGSKDVYLAYDIENQKFLAQAASEEELYFSMFQKFPQFEIIWTKNYRTGDNFEAVMRLNDYAIKN
jgi:hypothetical protein